VGQRGFMGNISIVDVFCFIGIGIAVIDFIGKPVFFVRKNTGFQTF